MQRSLLRVPMMLCVLVVAVVNNICCAAIPVVESLPAPTVREFPQEFRVTSADDDSDHYYLYFLTVLPGGKWCVAAIDHYYQPKNLKRKDWTMHSGNSDDVGWLGIEISTGRVAFLAVPQGDQSQSIRVWSEGLQGWRTGTCVVEIGYTRRDKEGDNAGSEPVEERLLWEWNPADSKVTLLGKAVPVGSLVRALNGSNYVASWSERDADPWNGRVRLRSKQTGESYSLRCRNTNLWAKRVRKRYIAERQSGGDKTAASLEPGRALRGHAFASDEVFGPTSDRHSVISVSRYSPHYPVISIRRINLAANGQIDWELKRSDLEALFGTRITCIRLVDGTARPCPRLPIVILGEDEKDQQCPLWTIDTQSGKLDGPYAIPWNYSRLVNIDLPIKRIQASNDGQFVVYGHDRPRERDEIIVFDTRAKRIAARRSSPSWEYSFGIESSGRVLILGEQEVIYSWRHPDTGPFDRAFALKPTESLDDADR